MQLRTEVTTVIVPVPLHGSFPAGSRQSRRGTLRTACVWFPCHASRREAAFFQPQAHLPQHLPHPALLDLNATTGCARFHNQKMGKVLPHRG